MNKKLKKSAYALAIDAALAELKRRVEILS